MDYHYSRNRIPGGPISETDLQAKLDRGELKSTDMCWQPDWAEWREIGSVFSTSARPTTAPPPPLPMAGPAETSRLAIASLVLGLTSTLLFLTAIPGVICGHMARSRIKASAGRIRGAGLALAGLIISYVILSFVPIGMMAAMAIPAFQKVRTVSQEKAIINNLRQLDAAAAQYMLEQGVSSATYDQLVGPHTYIHTLQSVTGEDYTNVVIHAEDTVLVVRTPDGRSIEYSRYHHRDPPAP
jgi:type IV pilus assembly protein PilA